MQLKTKRMKDILAKIMVGLLCVGLVLPNVSRKLSAAGTPTKDEVVYGKLQADGTVDHVYIVNAFTMTGKGMVFDQGNYDEILNLTNTNPIDYQNGTVAVSANQGRFYYQGNARTKDLPWLITLRYTLDGLTTPARDLSGKTGALQMQIKIERNPKVDGVYFENYVLQVAMTVNAEKATNLLADGATIANAGANKVINWMVLPGQNADYTLTADIADFYMPGIQISAVPLNLEFKMPDMTQYTSQFADLHKGVAKLNDGAKQLQTGTNALVSGASESASGAQTLAANGPKLSSGLSDLSSGIKQYSDGVSAYVDGVAQLGGGSSQLLDGYRQLASGLDQVTQQNAQLTQGSSQIASALNQIVAQMSGGQTPDAGATAQLADLSKGSQAFYDGLKQINDGLKAIVPPLKESATGLGSLSTALATAAAGLPDIANGLDQANAGFASAIDQLVVPPAVSAADVSAQTGVDATIPDVQILLGYIETSSAQTSAALSGLKDGLNQLLVSYQTLAAGLHQTSDGFDQIVTNLNTISAGLNEIATNLETMSNGLNTLVLEYDALNKAIAMLTTQLGQLPELTAGLAQLATQYSQFDSGLKAYTDGVAQIAGNTAAIDSGLVSLNDGIGKLVSSGASIKDGANSLASGATSAADGVTQYNDGVKQLSEGLKAYSDGIKTYSNGVNDLAKGTQTFDDSLKDIDKKFEEQINQEIEKMIGGDFTIKSFASPKNTSINSVQFVMMTPEIAPPAKAEPAPIVEEKQSFWDKLKNLFK